MGIARVLREQLRPEHEVFVAELGDHVVGDIASLCRLLRPTVGVLTTLGPEHLERFGSMENVVASKRELLAALPQDGIAVLNADDELARGLEQAARVGRTVRYGARDVTAEVRALDVRTTRVGLAFSLEVAGEEPVEVRAALLGEHNVSNLLAAAATAHALGMSPREIATAIGGVQPIEHRLQPIHAPSGVLVIDDAFNSNPTGAAAALDVLASLEGGRKILVTPGMIELGEREAEENRLFGVRAARACDEVILVGRGRAEPLLEGLGSAGFPAERTHVVDGLAQATELLGTLVRAGDVVLFENDLPDTYAD
jgi:UDP-N-acetylmuramoyl-tripeptide--D-alanyl-D-alanine ligase